MSKSTMIQAALASLRSAGRARIPWDRPDVAAGVANLVREGWDADAQIRYRGTRRGWELSLRP